MHNNNNKNQTKQVAHPEFPWNRYLIGTKSVNRNAADKDPISIELFIFPFRTAMHTSQTFDSPLQITRITMYIISFLVHGWRRADKTLYRSTRQRHNLTGKTALIKGNTQKSATIDMCIRRYMRLVTRARVPKCPDTSLSLASTGIYTLSATPRQYIRQFPIHAAFSRLIGALRWLIS